MYLRGYKLLFLTTSCGLIMGFSLPDQPIVDCPICRTRIQVHRPSFVEKLPSNLYIDSLLQLVGVPTPPKKIDTPPTSPGTTGLQSVDLFAGGTKCSHCKTLCDSSAVNSCEHCKLVSFLLTLQLAICSFCRAIFNSRRLERGVCGILNYYTYFDVFCCCFVCTCSNKLLYVFLSLSC